MQHDSRPTTVGNGLAELLRNLNDGCTDPSNELELHDELMAKLDAAGERRRNAQAEQEKEIAERERALTTLRASTTRQATNWKSAFAHEAEMSKLETRHFEAAKKSNEQENKLHRKEAELKAVLQEYEDLERTSVGAEKNARATLERDSDGVTLALQMYRQLGFHPAHDVAAPTSDVDAAPAAFSELSVRSTKRKQASTHRVDQAYLKQEQISPFILAQQLWLASE